MEDAALVQYICLYWEDVGNDKFPQIKKPQFWNACSDEINKVSFKLRSGMDLYW